jgi:hypothetical protein
MLHIWSFDPGETTGWCHLSVHNGEVGVFNSGQADHFQIGNMLYDNPALKAAVKNAVIETVFVCESYIQRPGKTQAPWSLETIGLIRYFANVYGIPFHLQAPSEAKTLITDKVIKKADLWVPGQKHAMDSVRHVLYYLVKERKLLTECLRPEQS